MAFKAISLPSSTEEGVPWVQDYVESLSALDEPECFTQTHLVREIYFSAKGVTYITANFKSFLFKSNPYYKFTQEAVELWAAKGGQVPGLALVVQEDKPYFSVGIEDEVEVSWSKEKKGSLYVSSLITLDTSTTGEGSQNPLLSSVPYKSSPDMDRETTRKGRSKNQSATSGKPHNASQSSSRENV